MKKKIIITMLILLFLLLGISFCVTRRIDLSVDSDGKLKGSGEITISFKGSDKYTDEELCKYLFETDIDANPFVFLWKYNFFEPVEIPFVEEYDVELKGLTSYEVTFYEKSIVGYVDYMGSYKYFDKDGIVVESSDKLIENVPYVTGIDVDYIVLHSKLPVRNDKVFDVLLDVTQLISKYGIDAKKINISSDLKIKIYLEGVRVELGKNEKLAEKIMDLKDIIPKLGDVKGVLNMEEYDSQGKGYTLKKDE